MKLIVFVFLVTIFNSTAHAKYWTHGKSCPGSSHGCSDAQATNNPAPVACSSECICCAYTNNPKEKVIWSNPPKIKDTPKMKDTTKLN